VDSGASTWSHNAASGNAGIAWVYGVAAGGSSAGNEDRVAMIKARTTLCFSIDATWTWLKGDGSTETYGAILTRCNSDFRVAGQIPITWNGNTFTVDYTNGSTRIFLTGTLSADGSSISNWEVSSSEYTGFTTTIRMVGSNLPVPLTEYTTTVFQQAIYTVNGAAIADYLSQVEWTKDPDRMIGVNYSRTQPPTRLTISFQD